MDYNPGCHCPLRALHHFLTWPQCRWSQPNSQDLDVPGRSRFSPDTVLTHPTKDGSTEAGQLWSLQQHFVDHWSMPQLLMD